MNAAIVILQDGSPCLVYDEALAGDVGHVELSYADHQMTIVYEIPPPPEKDDPFRTGPKAGIQKLSKIARKQGPKKESFKLDYPIEHSFFKLLEKKKLIAIGSVEGQKVTTLKIVPVVFTKT